jgi:hypothetical protein
MAARQDEEDHMLNQHPTTPPRWAESLLRTFLAPADRDSVSGDLLEEYRESILPERGAAANRWYVRQVAWYVLRATGPWAALVAAVLIGRYLLDTLAPVQYTRGAVHPRSAIMTWALFAIYGASGCWHAWRTGRLRTGVAAAFVTATLGGALSSAGTIVCLAIWHDPATWRAIDGSGGIDEALYGVPLILMVAGTIVGSGGALIGKVLPRLATQ